MQFQIQANLTLEQFLEYWRNNHDDYLDYKNRLLLRDISFGLSFKQAKNQLKKQGFTIDEKQLADVYSLYVEFCKPQTLTVVIEKPDYSKGAVYYYNVNSCLWDSDERYDAVQGWMQDPRSYAILVRNASGVTLGRAWAWFDGEEKTAFNPYGLNDKIWENIFTKMGMTNTPKIYPLYGSLYMNDRRVHSNSNRECVIMNWLEDDYDFDLFSEVFLYKPESVSVYLSCDVKYVTAKYNAVYSSVYGYHIHRNFAQRVAMPHTEDTYVFKSDAVYGYLQGAWLYMPYATMFATMYGGNDWRYP